MITTYRGTTPTKTIKVSGLALEAVSKIYFIVRLTAYAEKVLIKEFPSADVEYVDGEFLISFSQEDTFNMNLGTNQIDGQTVFADGSVGYIKPIHFLVKDMGKAQEIVSSTGGYNEEPAQITEMNEQIIVQQIQQETDPVYSADKPFIALKTEVSTVDKDQKELVIEATFESAAQIAAWVYGHSSQVRQGTILRTLNDDPDFMAEWDGTQYIAKPIANIHASKIDMSDGNTVEQAVSMLNTKVDSLISALQVAIVQSRQQAEAYALKLVNEYADSMLYFTSSGAMTPDRPLTVQSKNITLTTAEQLIDTQTYTIPAEGVLKHNAIYSFPYTLTSVSSSRDTTIKIKYTVNGTVIAQLIAQYRTSYIDISEIEVVSLLNVDMSYSSANIKCEVFARTSSGADDVTVVYNDGMQYSGVKRQLIL